MKCIVIDKPEFSKSEYAIFISSEINNIESYILGKALRDIIKSIGEELGVKNHDYIKDFKKYVGNDHFNEIEKIGINLHFLELKFT